MFQGTGSDVGKSLLVAGLARVFRRRGLKVAPFKPQNMSNNAAVTADGGEIGRAQALQAIACGLEPSVHMNPVLLKPQSEVGSQIIVQGRMWRSAKAREYQSLKPGLLPRVIESFDILRAEHDLVLVEGAGSAAEINLRQGDIANMGFAQATNAPVIIIGDIDRGGVIASVVGMKSVLPADDAGLISGFLINKMRGDPTLFSDGMQFIAERTGWPALGLVPFFERARELPAEDGLGLASSAARSQARLKIAVLAYPRISNFDDFDPLLAEGDVELVVLRPGDALPGDCRLVILPGSKATVADLDALRQTGWDIDIAAHLRRGGHILGICGGYQMLGRSIADPDGIEGLPQVAAGLGLLNVETLLTGEKRLSQVSGVEAGGARFHGYEMHVGETTRPPNARAMLTFDDGRSDGVVTGNGRIAGCYVHGLFADADFRAAYLGLFGARSNGRDHSDVIEEVLDALAAHLERYVDCDVLLAIAR
ncbi:MAG: cobyric acid synthase [Beijerinckiaceae bacterium]|nr:cobyric acid synthase [Beijerinckiaceae bacterium]